METDKYLNYKDAIIRLVNEYNCYKTLYIAVDFDHTLFDFDNTGEKYDLLINIIKEAQNLGLPIILFTAREGERLEFAKKHCESIGINPTHYNENPIMDTRKPFYSLLLDDRAGLGEAYKTLSVVLDYIKKYKNGQTNENDTIIPTVDMFEDFPLFVSMSTATDPENNINDVETNIFMLYKIKDENTACYHLLSNAWNMVCKKENNTMICYYERTGEQIKHAFPMPSTAKFFVRKNKEHLGRIASLEQTESIKYINEFIKKYEV